MFLTCCHAMTVVDDAHHFSCIDIDRLNCVSEMFATTNQNWVQFVLTLSTMHAVYSILATFGGSNPVNEN